MTKPLPTGCIKENSDIGHLYIVDIEFDIKNAAKRELTYNKIYPPITEKQKIIDLCERSVFQLL